MSARRRTRSGLPRGITARDDGQFKVTVSMQVGEKETVSRIFPTLDLAKVAHARASAVRNAGGNVVEALDAVRAGRPTPSPPVNTGHAEAATAVGETLDAVHADGPTPLLPVNATNAGAATPAPGPSSSTETVPRFSEILDEFVAHRERILAVSDHSKAGTRKSGVASLRPGTVRNDNNYINNHLRPKLGRLRVDRLTNKRLSKFVVDLAERGFAVGSQDKLLILLRQIIAGESRSAQPEDFPWKRVRPISPKDPKRLAPRPELWGGRPGDPPPVVLMEDVCRLAQSQWAADRAVTYLMNFAGLRRGEANGLDLGAFSRVEGYEDVDLWKIDVTQQRDLITDELLPYVKSHASFRPVVLAPALFRYLVGYVERYHGVDLRAVPEQHSARGLNVNPAGRGLDGGFLEGKASAWASRWNEIYQLNGYAHDECGFYFAPHHLRKCLSTYLLNARGIIDTINDVGLGARPPADQPDELVAWLDRRLELQDASLGFYSADVSAYLGHKLVLTDDDDLPASPVTLGHYKLTENDRQVAIARAIDQMIRYELRGSGAELPDDPDWRDELPVLLADDPEWIGSKEAAALIGFTTTRLSQTVRDGEFVGRLMWRADGGHHRNQGTGQNSPAVPVIALLTKEVERRAARRNDLGPREAGRRLGVSPDVVMKQCSPTELELYRTHGGHPRIPQEAVDRVLGRLHDLVIAALKTGEPMTAERLRHRIAWDEAPFGRNSIPKRAWVEKWLAQLVSAGSVERTREGLYSLRPTRRSRKRPRS